MNQITWSKLTTVGARKIAEKLPMEVTLDGEPMFIISKAEDVIVVSDLHIRVRNMLKAMEKRARIGMHPTVQITTEMS